MSSANSEMAGIDAHHGQGEEDGYRARFARVFPGVTPTVLFGEHAPTVEARWLGVARVKLQWHGARVRWTSLDVYEGHQRQGFYTSLVRVLHGHDARSPKVCLYEAQGGSALSSWALQLAGFTEVAPLELEVPEVGPADRMSEYTRWKGGEVPEPAWHIELRKRPPNV